MEKCKYYRYFDKYAEGRRQRLRDVIDNKKLKSKFANPGPIRELYEKGSHHLVELIPMCAKMFEEEKKMCDIIFKDMPNCKQKFVSIISVPFQQISGMTDGILEAKIESLPVNNMLLEADLIEALSNSYPTYLEIFGVLWQTHFRCRRTRACSSG